MIVYHTPHVCIQCGALSYEGKPTRKYCSHKCHSDAMVKHRTNSQGYRVIRVGGKSVYEHRHVMEQHLGRKLLPTEICHHRDENRLNNDISNIEIVSRGHHRKIHAKFYRDESNKQCSRCLEIKPRADFSRVSNGDDPSSCMCRLCMAIRKKERLLEKR